VKAIIEPAPERARDADFVQELTEFVRARVARYMVPRSIEFVDEMPRLATGKLNKFALRDRFGQPVSARSACGRRAGDRSQAGGRLSGPPALRRYVPVGILLKGMPRSARGSAGSPSTRSAMMLRRISSVPPSIRVAGARISMAWNRSMVSEPAGSS